MTDEIESKFVCHNCISDAFLSNEVKETGECTQCSYCCEIQNAWTIEKLSHRIAAVLQEQFRLTTHEYEPILRSDDKVDYHSKGEWIRFLIGDIAQIDGEIAREVIELLYDLNWREVARGADDYYNHEAYYEEHSPDDSGFRNKWSGFRKEIGTCARFFNESAREMLDDIFGELNEYRTRNGEPVIREIGPGDSDGSFWRGRKTESRKELKSVLKSLSSQTGPPPSNSATPGRMNAAGISVFYGAFQSGTCRAEIRPPVGSYVVLAKFELLRSVRLLHLGLLREIYGDYSYFDPEYAAHRGREAFLEYLVSEICRPVMPKDETSEYLPAQVVAEYLANKEIDGIIFPSSQAGGQGENVVLFNHACRVDPNDGLPESGELKITLPRADDEDDRDIVIWQGSDDASSEEQEADDEDAESDTTSDDRELTLRIVPESVSVSKITAVKYDYDELTVIRIDKSELPPYPYSEMPNSSIDELLE